MEALIRDFKDKFAFLVQDDGKQIKISLIIGTASPEECIQEIAKLREKILDFIRNGEG